MYELNNEQVDCVNGGIPWMRVVKFLGQTAIGEAVVEGAKAFASAVGEAGGASTGGYGDSYHGNLPAGMQ